MNRKGFFFIIVSFILLTYILTSTYFWVRAIEMEENRYSESFRTTSMEMLLAQVNGETIGNYADLSAHYAFYRLNHHSITNPVKVPDGVDIAGAESLDGSELENIRLAMRELVLSGTASGDYFEGDGLEYTTEEKTTYTLEGWASQLNASLEAAGFELTELTIDEGSFEFNQVNFTHFELVFEMNMTIVDTQADSATSIVRSYEVRRLVDGTGMVDPYIARESSRLGLTEGTESVRVGKPIFLAPYWEDGFEYLCEDHDAGDGCYEVAEGSEGQGWFYGPVVMAEDASEISENATYNYILAGNYSEIIAVPGYGEFGAYILTNEPVLEDSPCTSKDNQEETFNPIEYDDECEPSIDGPSSSITSRPFMVYDNFDIEDFTGVDFQSDWDEEAHKLLFVARANPEEVENEPDLKLHDVSIYDIEHLRDFAMCGYYMPRNSSPSFLHRMFDLQGMFDSSSPDYWNWPESSWGMETLAVGRWAGGNIVPDTTWDEYSRVDMEFFSEVEDSPSNEVQMIKGMPGDKNRIMCNMVFDPDLEHVGHFRLSDWAQWDREEYDDIYWIETGNGDEDNIGCDNDEVANCEPAD
ncbi:hypothetical protein GF412_04380 [Candidatus Micrarchaeota archaeon]|nr:hypothetical protein [Candidatus Micrarchaeota archaeon]MBD3418188.1 hypothetical protein [Candidatus Micrarchaeota archaeon]